MTSKDTILMRYETLCGQLSDIVTTLEVAEHEELTNMYRKELTEDD